MNQPNPQDQHDRLTRSCRLWRWERYSGLEDGSELQTGCFTALEIA